MTAFLLHPRRHSLFLLALLALFLTPPGVRAQFGLENKPVTAELVSELSTVGTGKPFKVAVKLEHQPTWHVYGKTIPAGAPGLPTRVTWKLPEGWKAEELPWPATHRIQSTGGIMMDAYEGTVYLPYQITPSASAAAGSEVKLEGQVDALVCDPKTCMPVKLPFTLTLPVGAEPSDNVGTKAIFAAVSAEKALPAPAPTPASEPKQPEGTSAPKTAPPEPTPTPSASGETTKATAPLKAEGGLAGKLLLAFAGGLILNVMPCVFPVLGIKILGVVNQSGEDHRRVVLHGLAYTLGVLVCFWVLAGVILALRSGGAQIGWGAQLQSPIFVLLLTLFLFAFGLNMAGLFEVGTSATAVGSGLTQKAGLGGSFFSGLLATVVATPCAAPFLAPALAYAFVLPPIPSLLFFTVIGLGLSFPYLLLSAFPKLVSLLPRPGAWMESFKQAMSFLMFATAAFLLWTFAGMVDDYGLLKAMLGLVLVGVACWIYGRWQLPYKPSKTRLTAAVLTLVFFVSGAVLAWPEPIRRKSANTANGEVAALTWKEWSPELVTQLREEKKPVYIDFTARWCVTCQTNKLVYRDESLRSEFRRLGVVTLKADWTNQDEVIFKALQDLGKAAVPVNVLYVPGRQEPVVLNELLTVAHVKETLAKIGQPVAAAK
ncbi:protein-disulfide reductase DsbD family protein [Verrucomicrobium spinosum]|uniref:protein-disulfide reductase DsbD family protein n=2 Tax=Verrucomicrobium spinosum TaxID=2736 RepID=UPI00017450DC|nr:thioredoxin family protein [Verrucomicrobium spinosum]